VVNPKKLLHSKWSAVKPQNKEKHFAIIDVEFDEQQNVTLCIIQAVYSKQEYAIDWRELKDSSVWKVGWI